MANIRQNLFFAFAYNVAGIPVAAGSVYPEHRQHLFGMIPFAFLLACPLLHFFHGGHHHGQHRQSGEQRP